jgi:hypothetical protein
MGSGIELMDAIVKLMSYPGYRSLDLLEYRSPIGRLIYFAKRMVV